MFLRIFKILLIAFLLFIVFNFLFLNFGPQALGYVIHFRFEIPPFLYLESTGLAVGILLLIAFCLGMILAAFMGAFSWLEHSRDLKSKRQTIKALEREIAELRSLYATQSKLGAHSPAVSPSDSKASFSETNKEEIVP